MTELRRPLSPQEAALAARIAELLKQQEEKQKAARQRDGALLLRGHTITGRLAVQAAERDPAAARRLVDELRGAALGLADWPARDRVVWQLAKGAGLVRTSGSLRPREGAVLPGGMGEILRRAGWVETTDGGWRAHGPAAPFLDPAHVRTLEEGGFLFDGAQPTAETGAKGEAGADPSSSAGQDGGDDRRQGAQDAGAGAGGRSLLHADAEVAVVPAETIVLPTQKQLEFAHRLARDLGEDLPPEVAASKTAISAWIDAAKKRVAK